MIYACLLKEEIMPKSRKWIAFAAAAGMLWLSSMACNPIAGLIATKTPTETPTPTSTDTPTITPTFTPSDTPIQSDTPIHCALVNERYIDTSGNKNFSYVPPAGWRQTPSSIGSCTAWTASGGSGATLDFEGVSGNSGSAAAFGQAFVEQLGKSVEGLNVISSEPFDPDSGIDSYRVIFEFDISGITMHTETYFFAAKGFFVVGMYLRSADFGAELDAAVENCMRTVEIG
jgi:hypothetical protein